MELNKNIMEQKFIRVSFDLELAKKITEKSIEGKIVTRDGRSVRVLCWDAKADQCIVALLLGEFYEECGTYTKDGRIFMNGESPADLMLEIPEYMTFKDGDILSNGDGFVFILNANGACKTSLYACINKSNVILFGGSACLNHIEIYTFATEEEKQSLIDALKASGEPEAKRCLKILGVEEKKECEFNPFDKVLVRDDDGVWFAGIFSHLRKDGEFLCVGAGLWEQCIPYNEKTAHLLGTNDDWEGE